MDSKNKNILIGGLLAIVLVMAVGYAAFATQLNINGTASISSSWDVHYKLASGVTPGTATTNGVNAVAGALPGGGTASTNPSGTITYSSDLLTATLTANLIQPGDTVTYTLTPTNAGSLAAKASNPVVKIAAGSSTTAAQAAANSATALSWSNNKAELKVGNIKYVVSFTPKASVAGGADDNNITVTASYEDPGQNATVGNEYAGLAVTILYNQA